MIEEVEINITPFVDKIITENYDIIKDLGKDSFTKPIQKKCTCDGYGLGVGGEKYRNCGGFL